MPTGKEYAEKALEVYNMKPKAGYIWGQSGATWTAAKQENLEKKYYGDPNKNKDLEKGAKYGKKWIGHRVWDCSGLTSERAKLLGLTYHHGSNSSWKNDCAYKGQLTKGMKLPVGAWVYTDKNGDKSHIGIVTSEDTVIEAQGTINGVVQSKLSNTKWKCWGLGKGLTFDFIPSQTASPSVKKDTTVTSAPTKIYYPTLRRGSKGDLVAQLQTFLSKDGSNLQIDGIFGAGTQSAVRAFQSRHGLVVDGIVGPKTWAELLKLV